MQMIKINVLLALLGFSKTELAEAIKEDRSLISMTIMGQRKNRRVREKIVRFLHSQLTVESLFDDESSDKGAFLPADWRPTESIKRSEAL